MLGTRRQNRYVKLLRVGFQPWEARPLSKVPFKQCPYIKEMMKERQALRIKARKLGTSDVRFAAQIKELYRINGWIKKDIIGRHRANVWMMFREFENKYKEKFPEYDSPWQKRYRKWRDFLPKIERTMRKQRGLA